tara:strand:- start:262 stop:585 length:324 start_codon:yes stop_codon:yes gene_type:complete
MKNISQMMKQAQQMQSKIEEMQSQLSNIEVTGESGGGVVSIVLNGKGNVIKLSLDKSLINQDEVTILEDLIVAAHNDAKRKVEQRSEEEMKKITGGLNLPSGTGFPF